MTGLIIFAAIVLLLWAEITVFGLIGGAVGVLATIVGVFITAAIGIRLFRHFGRGTMRRMAEANAAGKPPVTEVADGIAIMIAATLLLVPGYVTDAIGLIFFIPVLRIMIVVFVLGSLINRIPTRHFSFTATSPGSRAYDLDPSHDPAVSEQDASKITIEGEFERKD